MGSKVGQMPRPMSIDNIFFRILRISILVKKELLKSSSEV